VHTTAVVASASRLCHHRTTDKMVEYARGAHERGLQTIIAGAGGAAHLPGMVAAMTPLPVIGVPVKTSALSVRLRCTLTLYLPPHDDSGRFRICRVWTLCTASYRCHVVCL
jgi:phosphoribosylaminoimidazole carboxylase PurE protein